MTIAQLFAAINATDALNGRVFYSHKTATVKLPFCFIERTGEQHEFADNCNYCKVGDDVTIELYTAKYDPALEAILDGVLDANDVTYTKTASYDNDGNFYLVSYDTTITN